MSGAQPDEAEGASPLVPAPPLRVGRISAVVFLLGAIGVTCWVVAGPGALWVLHHLDGVRDGQLSAKDRADALNAIRGQVLAIVTGILAGVAIYYTAANARTARLALAHAEESARRSHDLAVRTAERTAALTEQGQTTDRYTKAIEQLGSDKLDIRIGGIYALERIARDSSRDRSTIIEVLATFVREHSYDDDVNAPATPDQLQQDPDAVGRFRPDLQAALTVLGRLDHSDIPEAVDLTGIRACRADLFGDLSRAALRDADLRAANLAGANLARADLSNANLAGASFFLADLTEAQLADANLAGASLNNACLNNAYLGGANLNDTNLVAAILDNAHGLPPNLVPPSAPPE